MPKGRVFSATLEVLMEIRYVFVALVHGRKQHYQKYFGRSYLYQRSPFRGIYPLLDLKLLANTDQGTSDAQQKQLMTRVQKVALLAYLFTMVTLMSG